MGRYLAVRACALGGWLINVVKKSWCARPEKITFSQTFSRLKLDADSSKAIAKIWLVCSQFEFQEWTNQKFAKFSIRKWNHWNFKGWNFLWKFFTWFRINFRSFPHFHENSKLVSTLQVLFRHCCGIWKLREIHRNQISKNKFDLVFFVQ